MSSVVPQAPSQVVNHPPAQMIESGECRFADADAPLVSSLRSGDMSAFDVLVKRHRAHLFSVGLRITNCREDAEEVVQDALLNAFRHLDAFRGDSRFVTWLTRITINQALVKIRTRPRRTTSLEEGCAAQKGKTAYDIPAPGYTPEQLCSLREFEGILLARTIGMNEGFRQVLQLNAVEDLRVKEIAQLLGLSSTAVKSRLFRARRELRKRMERQVCSTHVWREASWLPTVGQTRELAILNR